MKHQIKSSDMMINQTFILQSMTIELNPSRFVAHGVSNSTPLGLYNEISESKEKHKGTSELHLTALAIIPDKYVSIFTYKET